MNRTVPWLAVAYLGLAAVSSLSAQEPKLRHTLKGQDPVNFLSFSPRGDLLASGSGKAIKLWDVGNGKEKAVLKGHQYTALRAAFSPDGTGLASGSHHRTVKLWDLATGKEKATLPSRGHVSRQDARSIFPRAAAWRKWPLAA